MVFKRGIGNDCDRLETKVKGERTMMSVRRGIDDSTLKEGSGECVVRNWRVPTQHIPSNEGSTKGHLGENGDGEVETPVVT